jgi:hypothetical protein
MLTSSAHDETNTNYNSAIEDEIENQTTTTTNNNNNKDNNNPLPHHLIRVKSISCHDSTSFHHSHTRSFCGYDNLCISCSSNCCSLETNSNNDGINWRRLTDYRIFRLCRGPETQLILHLPISSVDKLCCVENSGFAFLTAHDDACDYLCDRAWDKIMKYGKKIRIMVHSQEPLDYNRESEVTIALENSFRHRVRMTEFEVQQIADSGCTSGLIAIVMMLLILCITIPIIVSFQDNGVVPTWMQVIYEIMAIALWVSIWNPYQLLVYGSFEARTKLSLVKALADAEIQLITPPNNSQINVSKHHNNNTNTINNNNNNDEDVIVEDVDISV